MTSSNVTMQPVSAGGAAAAAAPLYNSSGTAWGAAGTIAIMHNKARGFKGTKVPALHVGVSTLKQATRNTHASVCTAGELNATAAVHTQSTLCSCSCSSVHQPPKAYVHHNEQRSVSAAQLVHIKCSPRTRATEGPLTAIGKTTRNSTQAVVLADVQQLCAKPQIDVRVVWCLCMRFPAAERRNLWGSNNSTVVAKCGQKSQLRQSMMCVKTGEHVHKRAHAQPTLSTHCAAAW